MISKMFKHTEMLFYFVCNSSFRNLFRKQNILSYFYHKHWLSTKPLFCWGKKLWPFLVVMNIGWRESTWETRVTLQPCDLQLTHKISHPWSSWIYVRHWSSLDISTLLEKNLVSSGRDPVVFWNDLYTNISSVLFLHSSTGWTNSLKILSYNYEWVH